jgi:hypothetical protein
LYLEKIGLIMMPSVASRKTGPIDKDARRLSRLPRFR